MDRFTELELFVYTAELGTLSRAAEKLEISNAAASRHLAALETRLGVRLVERSTRRLSLTNSGHDFYAKCDDFGGYKASCQQPGYQNLTCTGRISMKLLEISTFIARWPLLGLVPPPPGWCLKTAKTRFWPCWQALARVIDAMETVPSTRVPLSSKGRC